MLQNDTYVRVCSCVNENLIIILDFSSGIVNTSSTPLNAIKRLVNAFSLPSSLPTTPYSSTSPTPLSLLNTPFPLPFPFSLPLTANPLSLSSPSPTKLPSTLKNPFPLPFPSILPSTSRILTSISLPPSTFAPCSSTHQPPSSAIRPSHPFFTLPDS